MDALRKLVIMLVGYCMVMGVSILTMIYGWGLEPKNWFVIAVLYPFSLLVSAGVTALGKD